MYPKLLANPHISERKISFTLNDKIIELQVHENFFAETVVWLQQLDGKHSIQDVLNVPLSVKTYFKNLINDLLHHDILIDATPPVGRSGKDVLFELEDLSNELLYKTLYQNIFWNQCQQAQSQTDIPINVMRGLVIENYHFLYRESYFDAPVLSYVANSRARAKLNDFYIEEYGHDQLLLKSLNFIGITHDQLLQTVPLPQTMALCNALAYWAHNDPLFFFTTLGILEGKDIKEDSFIQTALRIGLEKEFIGPVQVHSNINLAGQHGCLSREIFSSIPNIDAETIRRLRSQTHLFIELYDNFYTGVWDYYASTNPLLRLVDHV